jgi:diacylglycerol kinase (ATP)
LNVTVENPNQHRPGLTHIWRAIGIALQGLRAAFEHEYAFRLEVLVAAIALPAALLLPASSAGKALMIASILLVLIVELLNSALEAAVDHTSLEQHPLAVFLSILNALAVWGVVLFGRG